MRRLGALAAFVCLVLLAPAAPSWAHRDEEGTEPPARPGLSAEEAELEELASQPARILAQQALAMLEVTGDDVEAGERVEAALVSEDQDDVDTAALAEAAEALERGEHEAAIPLLDAALSRPLGADQGAALHEAGREYRPARDAQEIVGIIVGGALLLLGLLSLLLGRRSTAAAH
ncbi:MAG: hypothetical protein ABI726_10645 [bacterium]